MNATTRTILGVGCIAVIVLCAALLFGAAVGRARLADLTEQNLYSLSDGTRRIIDGLNQQVTLKLYYSRKAARSGPESIRFWNNYFLYVRDLLDEYAGRSDGRIRLEVIDPRPYSDEAERAIAAGVRQFILPGSEEAFFFGLAASNEFGKTRVIPAFESSRQEFVEYDVSKLLAELASREKKVVGVLSSLPVNGESMSPYMMQMMMAQGKRPPRRWAMIEQVSQRYEVRDAEIVDGAIDEGVDFLLVVHPKDLDEETLFAIDQFVMRGGRLLAFVDPHCREDRPPQQTPYAAAEASSNLNALLARWGVTMRPSGVAADRLLAASVQMRPDDRPRPFLPYLLLDPRCFNAEEVITGDLHEATMIYAGVLERNPDAGTNVRPLIETTAAGNVWAPMGPYELQMPDPERIARTVGDGDEPLMLACLIDGTFETNFPDGIDLTADAEDPDAATQPATRPAKTLDARPASDPGAAVVVVADVDMITDALAYRDIGFGLGLAPRGDNAAFLLNALDFLAGDADLISIRSRRKYQRPFEVIDRIEREAERATDAEVQRIESVINEKTATLESLGADGETDAALLNREILAKRREIEAELRKARRELRKLQAKRREKVEALQWRVKAWNLTAAPTMVLGVAMVLAIHRRRRAKRYASRRTAS